MEVALMFLGVVMGGIATLIAIIYFTEKLQIATGRYKQLYEAECDLTKKLEKALWKQEDLINSLERQIARTSPPIGQQPKDLSQPIKGVGPGGSEPNYPEWTKVGERSPLKR